MTTMTAEDAMKMALGDTVTEPDQPASTPDSVPDSAPASTKNAAVDSHQGPLTAEQAEKLINKAIRAAMTFADAMRQIVSKRAWEALGYSDPRHMMRERFTGKLINPSTGEPYSDSYIRRMSNMAWVLWSLTEYTGLDVDELQISARDLEKIPFGVGGKTHEELVDTVLEEIEKRGAGSAEDVQKAIDATLEASAAAGEPTPPEPDDDFVPSGLLPSEPILGDSPSTAESTQRGRGISEAVGESEGDWQGQAESRPRSAAESFDEDFSKGSQAPKNTTGMAEALEMMRTADRTTDSVKKLSGFPADLSEAVQGVQKALPEMVNVLKTVLDAGMAALSVGKTDDVEGLFDSLNEKELDDLHEQVEQAVEVAPTVQALAKILGEVAGERQELPGLGPVSVVAELCEEAVEVVERLEDFMDEIDVIIQDF
ncbi:hypothetical protein [Corynebacterium crudilactis]|uniref:Uncharacterized protein n=1 Tax=Corynebacterium crudilactis TaxID=1652495 RepID=A0A172QXN9_9CORY|nr:hypothetical protein [Corynebacterium crudilactis]ANE05464.1 hypothetical protein ccrud_14075 [Corynebacterium crudilactis]